MIALADYLDRAAGHRLRYGSHDCCTFMAGWLMALGCPDAMADRRGCYATRRDYKAALKAEGGILASCRVRFAAIGLVETDVPAAGDVALVLAPIGQRRDGRVVSAPVGAICADAAMRAIITSDQGLMAWPLPTIAAWHLPERSLG
jgi:hypothetical protein